MESPRIAYTYRATYPVTQMKYIGARCLSAKTKRTPQEDLGLCYFTSSKLVKKIVKEEGAAAFIWEILEVFSTKKEAFTKENELLQAVPSIERKNYFNKIFSSNGQVRFADMDFSGVKNVNYGKKFVDWNGRHHSDTAKQKISQFRIRKWQQLKNNLTKVEYKQLCSGFACHEEKNGMYGKHRTNDEKQRIKETRKTKMLGGNKLPWKGWLLVPQEKAACVSLSILKEFLRAGNLPRNLDDFKTKNGKQSGLLSKGVYPRGMNPSEEYRLIDSIELAREYWEEKNGVTALC